MKTMEQREDRLKQFLIDHSYLKWCTASICACNGCVNKHGYQWKELYPDEGRITKEEYEKFKQKGKTVS